VPTRRCSVCRRRSPEFAPTTYRRVARGALRLRQPRRAREELDAETDRVARRVASFDKQAIADAKAFVVATSLPLDEQLPPALKTFCASSARPASQARLGTLASRRLGSDGELERRLGGDDPMILTLAPPLLPGPGGQARRARSPGARRARSSCRRRRSTPCGPHMRVRSSRGSERCTARPTLGSPVARSPSCRSAPRTGGGGEAIAMRNANASHALIRCGSWTSKLCQISRLARHLPPIRRRSGRRSSQLRAPPQLAQARSVPREDGLAHHSAQARLIGHGRVAFTRLPVENTRRQGEHNCK
jgi:hypothetical protein